MRLADRPAHASRLVRARSVTISGDVPSVIASLVMTISRTSSAVGQVEHDVGHHGLEDRAQAARAGAALERLPGHRAERLGIEGEADVLELEQLLVLLGERVLGLDQDPHQRVLVERLERHHHRQAADQLGDQPEAEQVVGLDLGVGVLLASSAAPRLPLVAG